MPLHPYLHCYWPLLSFSIVCVSVCLSPSLSERISHPLLLQLLAASLLTPPSVPLPLCLLSYISTPPPFLIPLSHFFPSRSFSLCFCVLLHFSGLFSHVELPTVSLFCHLPPPSCLVLPPLPSNLLLSCSYAEEDEGRM